ncbi:elastin-like [Drosophila teissieri]|uniref:elastin-like n=1 Tax=Drosophila teissieri TaxID=7243 RepID=UPI001CBA0E39|nr:elastin-like [Drosophila teissieri]
MADEAPIRARAAHLEESTPGPYQTSKTATTAARIFSRLDSVEEVQRGRSGSAVGITPPGGPGAASAGVGSGSGAGAGTVAAAVVATGSPARSGQQQYVVGGGIGGIGGIGVGGGGGGVAGSAAVGVAGAGGVAAVRQRSASTVLDINLPQRKVSVGGGLAGPPSPVIRNGFSVYDPPQSLISSRHANFNGQGVAGGGPAVRHQAGHSSHHHHLSYPGEQLVEEQQVEQQERD